MRKCNICGSNRPEVWYKTKNLGKVSIIDIWYNKDNLLCFKEPSRLGYWVPSFSYTTTHFRTTFIYVGFYVC